VTDRALDRVRLAVARAVDGDQLREQRPVGLTQEPVEPRPLDLVDAETEQSLHRWALVRDEPSASRTVIRSLECATRERKRASL